MSAPNRGEALTLDTGFMGRPFAPVTSSNTDAPPDIGYMGQPFTAAPTGVAPELPVSAARPIFFSVSG